MNILRIYLFFVILLFCQVRLVAQEKGSRSKQNYRGGRSTDSICNLKDELLAFYNQCDSTFRSIDHFPDSAQVLFLLEQIQQLGKDALSIRVNYLLNRRLYDLHQASLPALGEMHAALLGYIKYPFLKQAGVYQDPSFTLHDYTHSGIKFKKIKDSGESQFINDMRKLIVELNDTLQYTLINNILINIDSLAKINKQNIDSVFRLMLMRQDRLHQKLITIENMQRYQVFSIVRAKMEALKQTAMLLNQACTIR